MSVHGLNPYVGFNAIPFQMVSDQGVMTDWEEHPVFAEKKVAGKSQTKRQFMGYDPDTLETRVLVAGPEDFAAIRSSVGTTATLVMLPVATAYAPRADQFHRLDADYLTVANTTLLGISDRRPLRDGRVLCTLLFAREHDEGGA